MQIYVLKFVARRILASVLRRATIKFKTKYNKRLLMPEVDVKMEESRERRRRSFVMIYVA